MTHLTCWYCHSGFHVANPSSSADVCCPFCKRVVQAARSQSPKATEARGNSNAGVRNIDIAPQPAHGASPPQKVNPMAHVPYCWQCKVYVEPQVVGTTETSGGPTIISPDGLAYTRVFSNTKFSKFCPHCGNQVFSEHDVVAERKRQDDETQGTLIASLLVLIPLAVIAIYYSYLTLSE